jgi:hypothetical protein
VASALDGRVCEGIQRSVCVCVCVRACVCVLSDHQCIRRRIPFFTEDFALKFHVVSRI